VRREFDPVSSTGTALPVSHAGNQQREGSNGRVLKQTIQDFARDECPTRAAALSYYTVFALPSLLAIIMVLIGLFVDPQEFQTKLEGQFRSAIGADGARQVRTMIQSASQKTQGAGLPLILGIAGLLIGATGAFMQLQSALNRAWNVEPKGKKGGIVGMVLKRILSLGMLLGLAFILLVSLVISSLLSAAGDTIAAMLGGIPPIVLSVAEVVISLLIIALVFAMIYKWLPDAKIAWKDVMVGAIVTAILFTIGKWGISFYLGRSDPGSAFGAAGALAVLLVWIYYSAMIVLFGAEFTQVWAQRHGGGVRAEDATERVTKPVERIRGGEEERAAD